MRMIGPGKSLLLWLCVVVLGLSVVPHAGAAGYANVQVDGDLADWADIGPQYRGLLTSESLRVSNDSTYLYLAVEGIGLSSTQSQFFLDTDNNAATGYNEPHWSHPIGADYLLETVVDLVPQTFPGNSTKNVKYDRIYLMDYTGTSNSWSWSQIAVYTGNNVYVKQEKTIEAKVPLSALGLTTSSTIRVGFVNYYGENDRLPGPNEAFKSYTLRNGAAESQAPTVPGTPVLSGAESTKLNLTWTPSTDNDAVAGYKVFRTATTPGAVEKFIGWSAGNTYRDIRLNPSTSYVYRVQAYDISGNASAKSAALTASTIAYPVVPASTGNWNDVSKLLFNYTLDEAMDIADMAQYDLLAFSGAVSPETLNAIKAVNPNIFIVAYISVGQDAREGNPDEVFFKDANGNPECDINWPSCFIDPTSTVWQNKVLDVLLPAIVAKGFDGFYLDTVEVTEVIHMDKAWGMGQLVQKIKQKFPNHKIFSGGGVHLLKGGAYDIRSSIDAMLFESFSSTWVGDYMYAEDGQTNLGNAEIYGPYTPNDHPRKIDYIDKRNRVNQSRFAYQANGTACRLKSGHTVVAACYNNHNKKVEVCHGRYSPTF